MTLSTADVQALKQGESVTLEGKSRLRNRVLKCGKEKVNVYCTQSFSTFGGWNSVFILLSE